jgi:hypothetical protein
MALAMIRGPLREDAIDKPEGNSAGKKGIYAEGDAPGVSAAEGSHGLGNEAQRG